MCMVARQAELGGGLGTFDALMAWDMGSGQGTENPSGTIPTLITTK